MAPGPLKKFSSLGTNEYVRYFVLKKKLVKKWSSLQNKAAVCLMVVRWNKVWVLLLNTDGHGYFVPLPPSQWPGMASKAR